VACSGGEPKQASSSVLPLALPRTPAERTALRAVDAFHPERDSALASGGTVVVHTESLPKQLNPLLVNTAYAKRLLQDVHATLMVRGRSGGFEPLLAERVQAVSPTEWEVTLREGVRWHDGQPFSSEDVLFSLSLFRNPEVRCDDLRWQYERLNATATDARTLRCCTGELLIQRTRHIIRVRRIRQSCCERRGQQRVEPEEVLAARLAAAVLKSANLLLVHQPVRLGPVGQQIVAPYGAQGTRQQGQRQHQPQPAAIHGLHA
jgi:hypothetical protein